ncbi:MAG: pilus assembly protein PilO [Deltaproteobacteria bacterium]|nr:pilus assembly protein PilO [Deltaproteobacteria bacterium]
MNDLIAKVLDKPKPQKIGILVGIVLLLLVVGYLYIYAPHSEQMTKLHEEIDSVQADRDRKKAIAANLPKLQKDLREWDIKLKTAVSQLPDSREIPELLSNISTKAREAGLEIVLFRPRAENMQEFYAEIPVDIVVRGGFYSAVNFFDEVGKLNRLVNIDNIDFKNPKVAGDQVNLEISTLATTYRFLDEAERKQVAEAKAAAAAKK